MIQVEVKFRIVVFMLLSLVDKDDSAYE